MAVYQYNNCKMVYLLPFGYVVCLYIAIAHRLMAYMAMVHRTMVAPEGVIILYDRNSPKSVDIYPIMADNHIVLL